MSDDLTPYIRALLDRKTGQVVLVADNYDARFATLNLSGLPQSVSGAVHRLKGPNRVKGNG
jgi:hypothetical protein